MQSRTWILAAVLVLQAFDSHACELWTSSLTFGEVVPIPARSPEAIVGIDVLCRPGVPYEIRLGTGTTITGPDRAMTGATAESLLAYGLELDGLGSLSQARRAQSLQSVRGIGSGVVQHHVLRGTIRAGQRLESGSFKDHVVVTLDW